MNTYEKCRECHLFIEENVDSGPDIAPFVHLTRGDAADDAIDETHEAKSSGEIHTLAYWRKNGPDKMRERFVS